MNKKIYWICQLTGWLGMVGVELVNYTFFIAQRFVVDLMWSFLILALAGLLITHLYRWILQKNNFFQKKVWSIWLYAFFSTILMATLLTIVNFTPYFFADFKQFVQNIRVVDVLGSIMNWSRYVGVWVIIYFMYKLLQQNNSILQEKLAFENIAKTNELELLKTQLNPHFLFNALNSIKALVIINPDQSRDAIVKLSELLRFTLQYGQDRLIPLQYELNEVKKYLELEQLRFGERLTLFMEVPNTDVSGLKVPPAILLTLAENAVKHGVANRVENSVIRIKVAVEADYLVLQLINSGNYMPGNTVGIGLKIVKRRLEEVYNDAAHFSIANSADDTVTATIQIPLV
jgi:sensor histidine kinase YesM